MKNKDDSIDETYNVNPITQYFKQISKIPLLTEQEEKELFDAYKNGDESARNKIIEANLRLVVSYSKNYVNFAEDDFDILDIIQEGNISLLEKGVERFDVDKGFKFSTYATWWLKHSLLRNCRNTKRIIPLPVHALNALGRICKARESFFAENGIEPTLEDLEKITGLRAKKIETILVGSSMPISLENTISPDKDDYLIDFIPDDSASIDGDKSKIMNFELNKIIYEILENYATEKEKEVIKLRYGLEDGKLRTLVEIGDIIGITRERVRQIEEKFLIKVNHSLYLKELEVFLKSDYSLDNKSNVAKKNKYIKRIEHEEEFDKVINYVDENYNRLFTDFEIEVLKELYTQNGTLTKDFKGLCDKFNIKPNYCVQLNNKYLKVKKLIFVDKKELQKKRIKKMKIK